MNMLENVVESVMQEFVSKQNLFTALDISNKVKETLPFVRHRDVSDLVKALFSSVVEPMSYTKTPISVTLKNGNVVTAILYHPLNDSWDLDVKYDNQKRAQAATKPVTTNTSPVTVVQMDPVTAVVPSTVLVNDSAMNASDNMVVSKLPPTATDKKDDSVVNKSVPSTRDLWANLFKAPSLFPRS
jgi:hypothetical protein